MMNRKRHTRASKAQRQSASEPASQPKRGFGELDPAQMGLGMPDWMTSPSPTPAIPSKPSVFFPPDGEEAPQESGAEMANTPEALPPARTVIEGMKVVCICKGIPKKVFWKALDNGMQTREDINRFTGSGSGACAGRRCGPHIIEMLRLRSQ